MCQFRVNIFTFEFFKKNPKRSSGQVEGNFDSAAEKFSLNVRIFLVQKPKKLEVCHFFLNMFRWKRRMQFSNSCRKTLFKPRNFFCWKSEKINGSITFCLKKLISRKCSSGHVEFSLDKSAKIFPPKSEKNRKYKKNWANCSSRRVQCSFDNPAEIFSLHSLW